MSPKPSSSSITSRSDRSFRPSLGGPPLPHTSSKQRSSPSDPQTISSLVTSQTRKACSDSFCIYPAPACMRVCNAGVLYVLKGEFMLALNHTCDCSVPPPNQDCGEYVIWHATHSRCHHHPHAAYKNPGTQRTADRQGLIGLNKLFVSDVVYSSVHFYFKSYL